MELVAKGKKATNAKRLSYWGGASITTSSDGYGLLDNFSDLSKEDDGKGQPGYGLKNAKFQLVITEPHSKTSRVHRITQTTTSIGRSRSCDVQLDDSKVSRKHAMIDVTADMVCVLTDTGATHTSRVNGEKVDRVMLRPNDKIIIGQSTLVFEVKEAGVLDFITGMFKK